MSLKTLFIGGSQRENGRYAFSGYWAFVGQAQVERAMSELAARVDALEREVSELRRQA